MKLAIMQPYFFPYIGYFQLIKSVDVFVVYDNIQYTKKGWINRNRYLLNCKDEFFTIPLKKDSDFLNVDQREISPDFNRTKLLNKIRAAYSKAPYFKEGLRIFERALMCEEDNLFKFTCNSIHILVEELDISTKLIVSSALNIDHTLKGKDKVISICKELNSDTYINPIGGVDLYSRDEFKEKGIDVKFIKPTQIQYKQHDNEFVPWLSILDIIMFNDRNKIQDHLKEYELI